MSAEIPISYPQFDIAIAQLQKHKHTLAEKTSLTTLIELLQKTFITISAVADEWIAADLKNRDITTDHWDASTSLFNGPGMTVHLIHRYIQSLTDIQKYGRPQFPGPVTTQANGQVRVGVFPVDIFDKILFRGFSAEIWLEPGITISNTLPKQEGKVALVLGAGNVSGLAAADILYKLINERHVVLLKIHPVINYLAEIFKKAFQSFFDAGFLQIVSGGIPESIYLCQHPEIEEIHLTGSDKTFEQIVFGQGKIGEINKLNKQPIINKRITGELGNVSPVIIVPGPWSKKDIRYQAENIAATFMPNNGFNCLATRVLIQDVCWPQRETLLTALRQVFSQVESSSAYYPGIRARLEEMIKMNPKAELFGNFTEKKTPWTFVPYLNPHAEYEPCFRKEIFGSFISETALHSTSPVEFIEKAVEFCNEKLWGTLNATMIVHPSSLKVPAIKKAIDQAVAELRYGTIAINQYAGLSYAIGTTSWGGFPGATYDDIQSGIGTTHNTFMLAGIQKSIFHGPFRVWPKPAWFPTNRKSLAIAKKLLAFTCEPSWGNLVRVIWKSLI